MRRAGLRGALATIVHTNGSIPSYESSRMLVREDGSIAGTIGGGCVEADVWAAAKEVMQKEVPRKMVFNLNHEASYDSGLICGGTLEIFVEPILPQPLVYLFGGGPRFDGGGERGQRGGIWNRGGGRSRDICEQGALPGGADYSHQLCGRVRKYPAEQRAAT